MSNIVTEKANAKIGWIGTGIMGVPMAMFLKDAGYDVSIYSRTKAKAESLLAKDGRRVMWAWYRGGQPRAVQSLPRELELPEDGVLRIKPLRELESLRYDEKSEENITIKKDTPVILEKVKGDHLELKLVIKDSGANDFAVDVLCDGKGDNGLRFNVNREKKLLELGKEKLPFELKKGESLTLRIFVDGMVVEVFANDLKTLMSHKKRAAGSKINDRISLSSMGADLKIDKITAWKMKSAYEGK